MTRCQDVKHLCRPCTICVYVSQVAWVTVGVSLPGRAHGHLRVHVQVLVNNGVYMYLCWGIYLSVVVTITLDDSPWVPMGR